MATIRFTENFSAVFGLLSLIKADNMVRIEYSSPNGNSSNTDHWTQIRDVMSLDLEICVNSLTVLEETMDMAEVYSATGFCDGEANEEGDMFCPVSFEDFDGFNNLLTINIETCVNRKTFIGPIEPTEHLLRRLDMPF